MSKANIYTPNDFRNISSSAETQLLLKRVAELKSSFNDIETLRQRVQELEKQNNNLWESFNLPRNEDILAIERLTAERDKAHQYWQIAEGRCDALMKQRDELVTALHHISLASQNSMSSQRECGKIARAAIASVKEKS